VPSTIPTRQQSLENVGIRSRQQVKPYFGVHHMGERERRRGEREKKV